jgi:hypothetical protein
VRWLPQLTWPVVAGKINLSVMSAAFLIFGLSLTLQAHRWGATPAYHILLQIFRAPTWGAMFLASGCLLGAAAWRFDRRWIVVTSLTVAFTLTTGWMLAFIVRYLTSPNTTPETWVSWAVFDFLLANVAVAIDRRPEAAVRELSPEQSSDLALVAINEARAALLRAEEAFARVTGQRSGPDAR